MIRFFWFSVLPQFNDYISCKWRPRMAIIYQVKAQQNTIDCSIMRRIIEDFLEIFPIRSILIGNLNEVVLHKVHELSKKQLHLRPFKIRLEMSKSENFFVNSYNYFMSAFISTNEKWWNFSSKFDKFSGICLPCAC